VTGKPRWEVREPHHPHEEDTMKKNQRARLQMTDIEQSHKQLGERELSDVELKVVGGGRASQGGTCSTSGDCDE
jgi:hypothetical protein